MGAQRIGPAGDDLHRARLLFRSFCSPCVHPFQVLSGDGDALYAREELVAELTAALCGAFFGYAAAPQENNAAYLKHWLTKLKEEPAFLVEILGDVNKAAKMIADKVTEPMNEPAAA